jgi:hypothetical protein
MPTPTPQAKVDMDPGYEKNLRALRDQAAAESEARRTGGQVRWDRPPGADGSGFDLGAMSRPFDRRPINEAGVAAISNPAEPGTTGDVVAALTMIETLACAQRAYLMRHTMTRSRAVAHAAGRKRGHGSDTGVYARNGVEYLRQILKQSRAKR